MNQVINDWFIFFRVILIILHKQCTAYTVYICFVICCKWMLTALQSSSAAADHISYVHCMCSSFDIRHHFCCVLQPLMFSTVHPFYALFCQKHYVFGLSVCVCIYACILLARSYEPMDRISPDDVVEATNELVRFWMSRSQSQGQSKVKYLTYCGG